MSKTIPQVMTNGERSISIDHSARGFETDAITLSVSPTGRSDVRGTIRLTVSEDYEETASAILTARRARELACVLLEMAERAETFTIAGFAVADEE